MKHKFLPAFLAFILVFSTGISHANTLNGTWELISGEYVNEEGKLLSYKDLDMAAMKVLSDSHFSFTSMKGGKFWASGTGSYTLEDGKYREELLYNSFGEAPGTMYAFDSEIEGNLWRNSRWKDGERVEYEVWRRVD